MLLTFALRSTVGALAQETTVDRDLEDTPAGGTGHYVATVGGSTQR